jgi:hypothetical protein
VFVVVWDKVRKAYLLGDDPSASVLPRRHASCVVDRLHGVEVHAEHGGYLLGLEPEVLRRGGVEEEKDVVELSVAAARYLSLVAASAQRDEPLGFDADA